MNTTFIIGLLGSLLLVTGAAWPDKKVKHPAKSTKNWFFAIGAAFMLGYASLNYLAGGEVFYIFLQVFANFSSVLMLSNVREQFATPLVVGMGTLMFFWSLTLLEDLSTLFFILGLTGIAYGYVMPAATFRRNLFLTLGSALIALFSYITGTWIFFWLNLFFAIFSGYYAVKSRRTL